MPTDPDPDRAQQTRLRWAHHVMLGTGIVGAAALAAIAATNSYFYSDDMAALYELRTTHPFRFFLSPVNIQLVPVHRLLMWLADTLFGFHFAPAILMLLAIHGLGIGLMYRVTCQLTAGVAGAHVGGEDDSPAAPPRLLAAGLTALYAAYPMVGIQFIWYSAGLHRLPYAVATLWAMDRWLGFRRHRRWRDLALIGLALVMACGAYGKGPLLAPHLIALELALWGATTTADRRRHLALLAGLLFLSALLALANLHFASIAPVNRHPETQQTLRLVWSGTRMFLRTLAGQLEPPPLVQVEDTAFYVGVQLVLITAAISIGARRANLRVWALMVACVLGNFAVVALSNRTAAGFAQAAVQANRYQFEVMVVVVPLLAIALRDAHVPRGSVPTLAIAACLSLSAHAAFAVHENQALFRTAFRNFERTRSFFDHFSEQLVRLRMTVPPNQQVLQLELMPRHVRGISPSYLILPQMTAAMGEEVRFERPGRWVVEDDGSIVARSPDFDPLRRNKADAKRFRALRKARERFERTRKGQRP